MGGRGTSSAAPRSADCWSAAAAAARPPPIRPGEEEREDDEDATSCCSCCMPSSSSGTWPVNRQTEKTHQLSERLGQGHTRRSERRRQRRRRDSLRVRRRASIWAGVGSPSWEKVACARSNTNCRRLRACFCCCMVGRGFRACCLADARGWEAGAPCLEGMGRCWPLLAAALARPPPPAASLLLLRRCLPAALAGPVQPPGTLLGGGRRLGVEGGSFASGKLNGARGWPRTNERVWMGRGQAPRRGWAAPPQPRWQATCRWRRVRPSVDINKLPAASQANCRTGGQIRGLCARGGRKRRRPRAWTPHCGPCRPAMQFQDLSDRPMDAEARNATPLQACGPPLQPHLLYHVPPPKDLLLLQLFACQQLWRRCHCRALALYQPQARSLRLPRAHRRRRHRKARPRQRLCYHARRACVQRRLARQHARAALHGAAACPGE